MNIVWVQLLGFVFRAKRKQSLGCAPELNRVLAFMLILLLDHCSH